MSKPPTYSKEYLFHRVQLGIRMNKPVAKVLRATAAYMDMPLSALIESMAVTAMEGQCIFGPDVMKQVERFKEIYGMDEMLDALSDKDYDEEVAAGEEENEDGPGNTPGR